MTRPDRAFALTAVLAGDDVTLMLTIRRAGAAVSASQPAESDPRAQHNGLSAAGRARHRTRLLRILDSRRCVRR